MSPNIFFIENEIPKEYGFEFTIYSYNEASYISEKYGEGITTFFIANRKVKSIIGRIHFVIENNEALSLPRSPFGYFELEESVSAEILNGFILHIFQTLQEKGVMKIKIMSFAQAYNKHAFTRINYVLLNHGFRISLTDINHHIPLEGKFEDRIKPMHLRKLQKCKKNGLVFVEEKVAALSELYHFILGCREERGHGLSLEYSQMKALITKFPEGYRIFSVRKQGVVIAATIVVIVNDEIIYNFFPASAKAYNILSPMVFLDLGLYNYCISKGYKILDLGISTTYGLINFKEGIGGEPSLKFVFEKLLE